MPGDIPSETALLARLRAGEDAAYAEIVRVYGGRLLAAARRIVRNEEDARDVVQDTMLAAFRSVDEFEGASGVATWLHRIAVNAALMKLRTRRRRPETSLEELQPKFTEFGHFRGGVRKWGAAADAALISDETRSSVRAAIDRLPDGHREVLVLRDVEGLSNDEVAAALGIAPGAAKVRVHRARLALRELLDPGMRGTR